MRSAAQRQPAASKKSVQYFTVSGSITSSARASTRFPHQQPAGHAGVDRAVIRILAGLVENVREAFVRVQHRGDERLGGYQRRRHLINLFVWPDRGGSRKPDTPGRSGYNMVHWTSGGLVYLAVSDLNRAELEQFARLAAS